MPKHTARHLEITAVLGHISTLSGECSDRSCAVHVIKVAHALRKSQELNPEEKEIILTRLTSRQWETLREYLTGLLTQGL